MVENRIVFLGISNDRPVTEDTDYEFLYQLKSGLLLALRESGTLDAAQYRQAAESLKQQCRGRALQCPERGSVAG